MTCLLQEEKLKAEGDNANGPTTNPFAPAAPSPAASSGFDLLGSGSPVTSPSQGKNDLFDLAAPAPPASNNPFASSMTAVPQAAPVDLFGSAAPAQSATPWGSQAPPQGKSFYYRSALLVHTRPATIQQPFVSHLVNC